MTGFSCDHTLKEKTFKNFGILEYRLGILLSQNIGKISFLEVFNFWVPIFEEQT